MLHNAINKMFALISKAHHSKDYQTICIHYNRQEHLRGTEALATSCAYICTLDNYNAPC